MRCTPIKTEQAVKGLAAKEKRGDRAPLGSGASAPVSALFEDPGFSRGVKLLGFDLRRFLDQEPRLVHRLGNLLRVGFRGSAAFRLETIVKCNQPGLLWIVDAPFIARGSGVH
jgi:hypothetical protein